MNGFLTFFAVAPKGVESLLADELKALGAVGIKVSRSGAFFQGELETGYRACLWLRTANRVLLPLREVTVPRDTANRLGPASRTGGLLCR